jgi:hypothetical protein
VLIPRECDGDKSIEWSTRNDAAAESRWRTDDEWYWMSLGLAPRPINGVHAFARRVGGQTTTGSVSAYTAWLPSPRAGLTYGGNTTAIVLMPVRS